MQSLFTRLLLVLIATTSLSGCLYSKVVMPLDTDAQETQLGTKVGRSRNHSIMWLVAWGDGGTHAAATEGGIKVVRHMDVERYVVLFGLYARQTTIVYGD